MSIKAHYYVTEGRLYIIIIMADEISDSAPILDPAGAIAGLESDELFNTLIDAYDATLINTLKDLKVAMDSFDYKEIRMKSHSLKGPSSYIHAERVRRAAEIVQQNVDKQEGPNIFKNYPMLIKECIILRREVRIHVAKRESTIISST